MVSHLLGTYATDDTIAETDGEIAHYVKPLTMSPLHFSYELWLKTVRRPHDYDEYVLKGVFIRRLLPFIWPNMQSYWSSSGTAKLPEVGMSHHVVDNTARSNPFREAANHVYNNRHK